MNERDVGTHDEWRKCAETCGVANVGAQEESDDEGSGGDGVNSGRLNDGLDDAAVTDEVEEGARAPVPVVLNETPSRLQHLRHDHNLREGDRRCAFE